MVYCADKLIENLKLFYKSNRPHFLPGFTGVITHLGCWENTEKLVNHELVIYKLFSCSPNIPSKCGLLLNYSFLSCCELSTLSFGSE